MKKAISVILATLTLMFSFSLAMASAAAVEYFCCPYCNKIYTNVDDYEECIINHDYCKLPNSFECPMCKEAHDQPGNRNDCMQGDIVYGTNLVGEYLSCPECHKIFYLEDIDGYNADVASHFPDSLYYHEASTVIVFPEIKDATVGWNNSADFKIGVTIPESGEVSIVEITASGEKEVAYEKATDGGYAELTFSTGNLTEKKTYRMYFYDSDISLVSAQTFTVTPKTGFFAKFLSALLKLFKKQYPVKNFEILTKPVQPK